MGRTSAFAQLNPSAPPAPQSMHRPLPADLGRLPRSGADGHGTARFEDHRKSKGRAVRDELTAHSHIHVSTAAGVVTLSGNVLSPYVAARAEQLRQAN